MIVWMHVHMCTYSFLVTPQPDSRPGSKRHLTDDCLACKYQNGCLDSHLDARVIRVPSLLKIAFGSAVGRLGCCYVVSSTDAVRCMCNASRGDAGAKPAEICFRLEGRSANVLTPHNSPTLE